ncbi:carbohydrate-binding module family 13 protein [Rhizophagus irregularis DAOM 181602=DAOM 197198]|nr:carbohydrate-binding module family 13 protein [Rhizophagus irregularis DAOM 181602=DAOM 197198]
MDEVQVWKHMVKWGHAQNPELSSDPTNFSKDDFDTLRNSLQHCIPFIRFYNLSSDEFSDEVLLYKKILPKELYKDLLKYFLSSNNQLTKKSKPRTAAKEINIDSEIITIQHAGNEILGGYNPIAWESGEYNEICEDSYRSTKDSLLFSFKNSDNIESYILSRVKNKEFAALNHRNFGPSFGDGDLILLEDYGNCTNSDYEKHIRVTTDDFTVEEYEVFQIIR